MISFSLFKVRVHIHPIFWAWTLILGWQFAEGFQRPGPQLFVYIMAFTMCIFLAIFCHEMGHALMARKFGAFPEVRIYCISGYAQHNLTNLSRKRGFSIASAGPAVNIIFAVSAYIALRYYGEFLQFPLLIKSLIFFYYVNFFLAVFNLLPIFPLDGGQMLYYAINFKNWRTIYYISLTTAVLAAIYALSNKFLFMAIILAYLAYQNYKATKGRGIPKII